MVVTPWTPYFTPWTKDFAILGGLFDPPPEKKVRDIYALNVKLKDPLNTYSNVFLGFCYLWMVPLGNMTCTTAEPIFARKTQCSNEKKFWKARICIFMGVLTQPHESRIFFFYFPSKAIWRLPWWYFSKKVVAKNMGTPSKRVLSKLGNIKKWCNSLDISKLQMVLNLDFQMRYNSSSLSKSRGFKTSGC